MLTFQQTWVKFQSIAQDSSIATLVQAKQDMNSGYALFNAAVNRYFTRKQQFADITANQQYYQVPIDSVRIMGMTTRLANGREYPVEQLRDEQYWRQINTVPQTANWARYYFMLGNDTLGLWPIPASTIDLGLRYWYEPRDHALTADDVTDVTSGKTVSITNGSPTVTASGSVPFTSNMVGWFFQVTDGSDGLWYEVVAVPNSSTLTLKSAAAGSTGSGKTFTLGQSWIFPDEYSEAPMDYALARYFESRNNTQRSSYHLARYTAARDDALEKYSSSSTSNVITDDLPGISFWSIPPDITTVM